MINELKNSLIDCEQDKIWISDLRSENENLLCEIDDIKIKMQKYLEELNISKKNLKQLKMLTFSFKMILTDCKKN